MSDLPELTDEEKDALSDGSLYLHACKEISKLRDREVALEWERDALKAENQRLREVLLKIRDDTFNDARFLKNTAKWALEAPSK